MKLLTTLLLVLLSSFAYVKADDNDKTCVATEFYIKSKKAAADSCVGIEDFIFSLTKGSISTIVKTMFTDFTLKENWIEDSNSHSNTGGRHLRSRELKTFFEIWMSYNRRRQLMELPGDQDHRELEEAVCEAIETEAEQSWLETLENQIDSLKSYLDSQGANVGKCVSALKHAKVDLECKILSHEECR